MPISMTCAGCHATFDVPDNLAGKTIRCTSCKAQMTIPAAGEKKPFGWAAKTPPPAVVEAIDDDEPAPVKTAPKVAAAVKAVVKKPVIELDDDDEDEPKAAPKKAEPKKLSGIKGSPPGVKSKTKSAVARRKEEDDDDDDKPRGKGKKKVAGGTNMPLLAGGGLALCAVIGVAVWLLFIKEKKSDTTTTASPTNVPGTPDIGSRGGPPGGMSTPGSGGGMPGSGMPMPGSGGGGGGGQQVQGEGFTIQMPGTPTTSGSLQSKNRQYLLTIGSGATSEVYQVVAGQMEQNLQGADASSALDIALADMKAKMSQLGGSVQDKSTTLGEFTGKEISASASGGGMTARAFIAFDRLYLISAGGGRLPPSSPKVQQFFSSFQINYTGSSGGAGGQAITSAGDGGIGAAGLAPKPNRPGSAGGFTPMGMTAGAPQANGGGSAGFGPPGVAIGAQGGPQPQGLGPVPQGLAGSGPGPVPQGPGGFPGAVPQGLGGPGPGPMPQGPGGSGLGPVPQGLGGQGGAGGAFGGGNGVGGFGGGNNGPSLSAALTIDAFYAAAFDAEKKEFFTVSARTNPSGSLVMGRLRRYSYPDFKQLGMYDIPALASRAVIDSEKGLLYIASVPAVPKTWGGPSAVEQQAGAGDVQVFELDQIRSNKISDRGAFKPLASMSVGATIRGLELSPDGKSLFCLTCAATASSKASLHQFDTTERKAATKPVQLPSALEMRKSADGKYLLVLERGAKADAGTSIIQIDMTALDQRKSLPLPGTATGVAAMKKDGQMVTGVMSANGGKLHLSETNGAPATELSVPAGKVATGWYVSADPDGKHLFVGSGGAGGFDAYEVTDLGGAGGLKSVASAKTATNGRPLMGAFHVAPDGEFLVFHIGTVLKVSELAKSVVFGGGGAPGGFGAPGGEGGAFQPPDGAGVPPGVLLPPGAPRGGVNPPGGPGAPPGVFQPPDAPGGRGQKPGGGT